MHYTTERPLYGTVASVCKIHGSGNLGVKIGVVSLLVTPSIPLGEFVLPVSAMLSSMSLKVLVPKGYPSQDITRALLNYELWLSLGHSGILMPRDQQATRGLINLTESD